MISSLSVSTVRRRMKSGHLPSSKNGGRRVIARADLEDFMQRRRSARGGERNGAHERPAVAHHAGGGTSLRRPVRSDPDHEEE